MDCPRSHYILEKSGMLPLFISYYCSLSINPQKLQKLRNHVVLFPMITFLFISNPFYFHPTEYTDSEMPDLLWNNVCLVSQLCLGLCDLLDCSPPGSSVQGIPQARILEWVSISSSRGSSPPKDPTHASCVSWADRWILYHWDARFIIK